MWCRRNQNDQWCTMIVKKETMSKRSKIINFNKIKFNGLKFVEPKIAMDKSLQTLWKNVKEMIKSWCRRNQIDQWDTRIGKIATTQKSFENNSVKQNWQAVWAELYWTKYSYGQVLAKN